jgi:hypothetical protein
MFNIHILSEVHQHLKIDFCNYHFNLILIIFSYYVEVLSSSSFRVCYYSHLHHHFEFTFNSLLTLSTSLSSFIFIITLNLIYISQRIQECINNFSINQHHNIIISSFLQPSTSSVSNAQPVTQYHSVTSKPNLRLRRCVESRAFGNRNWYLVSL